MFDGAPRGNEGREAQTSASAEFSIEERGLGSMGMEVGARDAVLEHARGVLAERFGVGISRADQILRDCARAQGRGLNELATAVVASCTTDETPLPRRLWADDDETNEAA
jgi:hypothetical protein